MIVDERENISDLLRTSQNLLLLFKSKRVDRFFKSSHQSLSEDVSPDAKSAPEAEEPPILGREQFHSRPVSSTMVRVLSLKFSS